VEERDAVKAQLENNILGGAFLRSKFIADKLAIPADLAEAKFRSSFKNENGNVVGYDANGNKILAPGRPGEVANFDEAMEVLVSNYSNRDQILKGSGASGSGAQGGGGQGGSKTISREAFAALAPAAQATTARDPNVTITD
jgi:hypothetical protein